MFEIWAQQYAREEEARNRLLNSHAVERCERHPGWALVWCNECIRVDRARAQALAAALEIAKEMRFYCLGVDASTQNIMDRFDAAVAALDAATGTP